MSEAPKKRIDPPAELIPATINAVIQDQWLRQDGRFGQGGRSARKESLADYWHLLQRRKGFILLAGLGGALLFFLLTLPQTPVYQAGAAIEVQDLNQDFLFNTRAVRPIEEPVTSMSDIATQVRVMKSWVLSNEVTAKLNPVSRQPAAPRPSGWRQNLSLAFKRPPADPRSRALEMAADTLRVRPAPETRIIEVSADSTDPVAAAEFVNALVARYIERNMEDRVKMNQRATEWLTRQLNDLRSKLEASEEALRVHAKKAGVIIGTGDTAEKADVSEQGLRQVQEAYFQAQAARIAKQSRNEIATTSPPDTLGDVLDDRPLQLYQEKISDLKRQIADDATVFHPEHPKMKRLQAQVSAFEDAFERHRSAILARIDNDYKQAVRHEDLLRADFLNQAAQVSDKSGQYVEYKILLREVESNRTIYDSMLQRMREANVASAMRASNVRILEPAEPSPAPYKPNLRRSIYIGMLAGLFASIAFVIVRERVVRTIQDPGNVATDLEVAELGVIPSAAETSLKRAANEVRGRVSNKLSSGSGSSVELTTWQRPPSLVAESFRALRTSLLSSGMNGGRPNVIVFTSAGSSEGKTMVLSNLGIAMAEIRRRTLLIDADMRKPKLHKLFAVDNSKGLSTLLETAKPGEAPDLGIQATAIPNLYVLPGGPSTSTAANLFHSPAIEELLKRARNEFDTILIDTPPMLHMPDARIIGQVADALILVIRSQRTTREAARTAVRRLEEDGVRVIGAVLNDWNPKRAAPGTYYYGRADS